MNEGPDILSKLVLWFEAISENPQIEKCFCLPGYYFNAAFRGCKSALTKCERLIIFCRYRNEYQAINEIGRLQVNNIGNKEGIAWAGSDQNNY